MNLLWDKILVDTHCIVALFHRSINRPVYYLFPNIREANRYAEKAKNDKEIVTDSIQIKQMKDLFQF